MPRRVRRRCVSANKLFAKAKAYARRFGLIYNDHVVEYVAPL